MRFAVCSGENGTGRAGILCIVAILICAIMLNSFLGAGTRSVSGTGTDTRPVLVIDAGHGGEDGGAISADGLVESEVNLDIALRVRDLARFLGIPVVLTRDSQELDYPLDAKTTAAGKSGTQGGAWSRSMPFPARCW